MYTYMRYIVVFAQQEISYAVGFDDPSDAVDFLYWGYDAYELVPYGVFDVLSGEVWAYEHEGEQVSEIDKPNIRKIALDYLQAAIRQTTSQR